MSPFQNRTTTKKKKKKKKKEKKKEKKRKQLTICAERRSNNGRRRWRHLRRIYNPAILAVSPPVKHLAGMLLKRLAAYRRVAFHGFNYLGEKD